MLQGIHVGVGKDGQVVAIPHYHGAEVLHLGQIPFTRTLPDIFDCRYCAVSPDGNWIIAGSHWQGKGAGTFVYEARTGNLVKKTTNVGGIFGFSPDSRWLVVGSFPVDSHSMRLIEVGTWKEWPLPSRGTFVFAPDSRTIAVSSGYGTLCVLRVPTGEELYRVEVPDQTNLTPQCFSADGAQLIALGAHTGSLYVWDLRTLRQHLRELKLDWDEPPYPEPAWKDPVPRKASLILGAETYFSQANEFLTTGQLADAITTYRKAIGVDPNHVEAHHHLGIVQKNRLVKTPFREECRKGTLTQKEKQKIHEFKITAGRIYILDLESTTFDAFLKLQDGTGKLLAEHDDIVPGVNLNARIVFAPREDGTYRLVAASFQEAGSGSYTLRIRELGGSK